MVMGNITFQGAIDKIGFCPCCCERSTIKKIHAIEQAFKLASRLDDDDYLVISEALMYVLGIENE